MDEKIAQAFVDLTIALQAQEVLIESLKRALVNNGIITIDDLETELLEMETEVLTSYRDKYGDDAYEEAKAASDAIKLGALFGKSGKSSDA